MYGIHTRFASAAISEGLGFEGDMAEQKLLVMAECKQYTANVSASRYTNVEMRSMHIAIGSAESTCKEDWVDGYTLDFPLGRGHGQYITCPQGRAIKIN